MIAFMLYEDLEIQGRTIKMKESVQTALDKIRPMLQRDGGDVELVDVEGGVVKVRLQLRSFSSKKCLTWTGWRQSHSYLLHRAKVTGKHKNRQGKKEIWVPG
jgi:hypothetical protein